MLVQMNYRHCVLDLLRDGETWFARVRGLNGSRIHADRTVDYVDTGCHYGSDQAFAEAKQIVDSAD